VNWNDAAESRLPHFFFRPSGRAWTIDKSARPAFSAPAFPGHQVEEESAKLGEMIAAGRLPLSRKNVEITATADGVEHAVHRWTTSW
jgi:hypothetical protein